MATPSEGTGPVERAEGKGYGRTFVVRRALLDSIEQTLMKLAAEDGMDKLPSFCYSGMGSEKVRIQLQVYRTEGTP